MIASESTYESAVRRIVHLYLHPTLTRLEGLWHWEAASDAVFCSDVIGPFPAGFIGTRGIIYPDDTQALRAALEDAGEKRLDLSFRIITTHGSVMLLQGRSLTAGAADVELTPSSAELTWLAREQARDVADQFRQLRQRALATDHSERQSGTGSWYYNAATHEAWYSDNVFRLHGLPPQSLNAHLLTFSPYIHPIDAPVVEECFDRAYQRRLPLDIIYRIHTVSGNERSLRLCTTWLQNDKGEEVLSALLQELTSEVALETKLARVTDDVRSRSEALRSAERMGQMGSWQLNVLTGKWSFSDAYYRLLGIQPRSVDPDAALLQQFVHPDDRELMLDACRRMEEEHICPELDYRILRNDGQTRYFQMRGRALLLPSGELMLSGTVRDTSLLRAFERRETRSRDVLAHREELLRIAERAGSLCTWTWDLQRDKMEWSSGCYDMLGYKPNFLELSQKLLGSFLHSDDRKRFNDSVDMVRQTRGEVELELQMIIKETTRYLRVHMRVLDAGGTQFFVAVFHDETARRQQEQDLASSERLLALLGNLLPGKMLLTDAAQRIVRVNDAAHKWLQGRGQAALGQNLFEVLPRLKDPGFQEGLSSALKGTASALPSLLSAEAGSEHQLVPVDGEASGHAAVLHLLTEGTPPTPKSIRLLAETLADAVSERVIVLDRRMNYLVWNRACELHYGRKREEVLGRNLLETTPGFLDDPGYNDFKHALRGETVQLEGRHEEGYKPFCLVPVIDESGNVTAVIWVAGTSTGKEAQNGTESPLRGEPVKEDTGQGALDQ